MPLKVLPSMTKPPCRVRAPRWMFDSVPWRRPLPHSAASTTRSRVWRGLTFTQAEPRRPASQGAVERLHDDALVAVGEDAGLKSDACSGVPATLRGTR